MHRLDCVSDDDNRSAIGVCTTRGAAVCESCARIGHQAIRNLTGLALAVNWLMEIHKVACVPCARALDAQHGGRYRFVALAGHVLDNR